MMTKSHVCLFGKQVCEDWELIRLLKSWCVVTIVQALSVDNLVHDPILNSASLIVIDCTGRGRQVVRIIKTIERWCRDTKRRRPAR